MEFSLKKNKISLLKLVKKIKKKYFIHAGRIVFWFSIGVFLASFLLAGFSYLLFQKTHENSIYPGISVYGVDFSGKKEVEVRNYFERKNELIQSTDFVFMHEDKIATVSAKEIDYGYDANLLSTQAYSLGRSKNAISNISLILQGYFTGINLEPSYRFSEEKLKEKILPIAKEINIKPVDALFQFEGGRVKEFKPSENGRMVNFGKIKEIMIQKEEEIISSGKESVIIVQIPVETIEPKITTEKANDLGIRELIGSGTSLFQHSIENRIYNVNLAAQRLNGILVAPGETFSFAKAIGYVSSFTGYKQAYVIQNGKTVLGDGGGVCQVSTTLFRAILNSGLPVTERTAHSYRVGYYEQDSPPGIDATVYVPSVDLKFKNDTGNHILIQTVVDLNELRLTFNLYGTKDGRISEISTPVVLNQTPAPEPKYEDDPTLPKGQVKQIDFAAAGANVYFTRKVSKDGKVIISEQFSSNYRPWQAVYLRGTKE
ncbi:MAG: VanW family protein [Candidatus Levybacteria bacterium]|nr:VanW family protein [Candidatus Levybacteria bacterium]